MLSPTIGPQAAADRVRVFLTSCVTQQHQAELRESGQRMPDTAMAERWQEELRRVHDTEFLSVDVRRPLPDYLSVRPSFVVRIVLRQQGGPPQTRYYWLGRTTLGAETSKWVWLVAA
jgi:hypothetical protein